MQASYIQASRSAYSMSLNQAVDESLTIYDMSPSQEAEETGRTVATFQD